MCALWEVRELQHQPGAEDADSRGAFLDEERSGEEHALAAPSGTRLRFLDDIGHHRRAEDERSEEHTSELQSLMRISYAVFCLKKKRKEQQIPDNHAKIVYQLLQHI